MSCRLLAYAALVASTGCVHAASGSVDGGVPEVSELGITDPDPEEDPPGPQFCNPTGLQGAAQQQCYEHNETLYKDFDDEAKAREPWFNFTPDSWAASKEVDARYVVPVVREDEAVSKLEAAPLVELTPAEARFFTGKAPAFPGLKPYLVRALLYFRATGAFSVFEKNQAIFVRHDSLGETTPAETRAAVVVYLGYRPSAVYVDCQVAE